MITFAELGRYGRLGNQMFQIASTIGIARRFGYDFAFPYWKNFDHLERFGTKEDIDIQKHFVNPLPSINETAIFRNMFINWGYQNMWVPDNVSLSGHMQSEKYFKQCEKEVRHYFKMTNEFPQNDYVAVHVRLGDYDDNYHPRLKIDYYERAMKEFPNATFLVFSDGIEEAKKMLPNCNHVDTGDTMTDFRLMKSCKHFIIGNSTYSWWAAWLGEHPEKKVVAPKKWFGQVANLSADDIYAENWLVV